MDMITRRSLFALLALVVIVSSAHVAQAEELSIVDVLRHITLADDDVVYKDFYLNGGEGDGLKKNMVVTAVRKIQVRDSSGSQNYGELTVPVGQLRIIAIQGKIAVAREYKLLSRDELPMLEQTGLMSGDRIDLKGAFIDNAKPKYVKPTVAEATSTQTQIRVAALAEQKALVKKTRTPGRSGTAVAKVTTPAAAKAAGNRAPASASVTDTPKAASAKPAATAESTVEKTTKAE